MFESETFGTPGVPDVPLKPYPWKTRVFVPLLMVLLLLALLGWSARQTLVPRTDVRVIPVMLLETDEVPVPKTSAVAGAANDAVAQAAGWVEPDPYPIAVPSLIDGVVREVRFLEGQRVEAGQVLVSLVSDDAALAVRRAEAELASRKAELAAATEEWENPVELDRAVQASEAEVDQLESELRKSVAIVAMEQARLREAEDQFSRLQGMELGATSARELEVSKFRLEAQKAGVEAAEASVKALEGSLKKAKAELSAARRHRELRTASRLRLDAAKAAVGHAEAVLGEATLNLERAQIRAPMEGVVLRRLVEPGTQLVRGSDSRESSVVAWLYEPRRLQVRVDVPLADVGKIQVGMPAEVMVESVPGKTLRGEVTRLADQADPARNTLQFKVRILDVEDGLKPEMLARVRFLRSTGTSGAASTQPAASRAIGTFAPEALIQVEGTAHSATVVDPDSGVCRRRPVKLGTDRRDGWVLVTEGLYAGEWLLADPPGLADGARVRVVGELAADKAGEGV